MPRLYRRFTGLIDSTLPYQLEQAIKCGTVVLTALLLTMACFASSQAADQAVDAPTATAAQEQLQQAILHQLAAQDRLLPHREITPSRPFSLAVTPLVAVGRPSDWTPVPVITDTAAPTAWRAAEPLAYSATCTVTRATDDSQPNTLRWCLQQSQELGIVAFDPSIFPAASPVTITLTTPLPPITQNGLLLDGCDYDSATQRCRTAVAVSGLTLELGSGLVISGASGVTVNGLIIQGFPDDGILIQGGAQGVLIGDQYGQGRNIIIGNGRKPAATTGDDAHPAGIRIRGSGTANNLVLGNWIGIGADGQSAQGNKDGIQIINGATDNRIGGITIAQRNLISGNREFGVYINNGSHRNLVLGNWIGVNAQGQQAVGNAFGILVSKGSHENQIGGAPVGAGNLVSGNRTEHIRLETGSERNRVRGNWIGVDVSGTYTVGIPVDGVAIFQASNNQIGGTETGARNLIAGCNLGVRIGEGLATGNTVQGNWIGVDVTGKKALGNGSGIGIVQSSNNLIGGVVTGAGNLISGGQLNGIEISGTTAKNNQVQGNLIGVDVTGMQALGNGNGIFIEGASYNIIGGETAAARNLISGNGNGIRLQKADTAHNRITGNWIGVDPTGKGALGNLEDGVVLLEGPQYNLIGGATEGSRNLISGNGGHGINIQGVGSSYNQVHGNFIGVDVTGYSALGNGGYGIFIAYAASFNEVGGSMAGIGNLISGNLQGVTIAFSSSDNKVQGNKIGVNPDGAGAISNTIGIAIYQSAQNWIGGAEPNTGNLISGNQDFGIAIFGIGSNENRVTGNLIGVDSTGTFTVGISISAEPTTTLQSIGVGIWDGASSNIIGGSQAGEGNVISGNQDRGVVISGANSSSNQIVGNVIGPDRNGLLAVGRQYMGIQITDGANKNIIGGQKTGERNVISGNGLNGIQLRYSGTSQNQVKGNYIGVDITGRKVLSNTYGIFIGFGASDNIIGGDLPGEGNVISGNQQTGIWMHAIGTNKNLIKGNLIGIDFDSSNALGNFWGIQMSGGTGQNELTGNVISGNTRLGILIDGQGTAQNQIQGNKIGTNISGTKAISNSIWGITIEAGASNNRIGGTGAGEANVISGNGMMGIRISDTTSIDNQIIGNFIGTDANGGRAIGNGTPGAVDLWDGSGVFLYGANKSIVAYNQISGNQKHGILILGMNATANHVHGNRIGISSNNRVLPNQGSGIWLQESHHNQIGISNTIAFNLGSGIVISGVNAAGNTLTRNLIYANRGPALQWHPAVEVTSAENLRYAAGQRTLRGSACPGCSVEVYASASEQIQARHYLGSTVADANGAFTLTLPAPPTLPYLTALATRPVSDGTTLPFAKPIQVPVNLVYLPLVQR